LTQYASSFATSGRSLLPHVSVLLRIARRTATRSSTKSPRSRVMHSQFSATRLEKDLPEVDDNKTLHMKKKSKRRRWNDISADGHRHRTTTTRDNAVRQIQAVIVPINSTNGSASDQSYQPLQRPTSVTIRKAALVDDTGLSGSGSRAIPKHLCRLRQARSSCSWHHAAETFVYLLRASKWFIGSQVRFPHNAYSTRSKVLVLHCSSWDNTEYSDLWPGVVRQYTPRWS
jgi:hypothetical protein